METTEPKVGEIYWTASINSYPELMCLIEEPAPIVTFIILKHSEPTMIGLQGIRSSRQTFRLATDAEVLAYRLDKGAR